MYYINYSNKRRPPISATFEGFNKRRGAYSCKYSTKRYYYGFKLRPQISAGFLEKKFNKLWYISLGPLYNLTFTNKLLAKGQNQKKKTCKP